MRALRIPLLAAANLVGLAAFSWPFVAPALVSMGGRGDVLLVTIALFLCLGALLFVELGRGALGAKQVALLGVLGAAMVALRLPGFIAGFSAMFIVVLVAGNAFGPAFGFLLGATGTFASGLFVGGLGPWLPFQMVAVGWVGLGAGLLPGRGRRGRLAALALYGAVSGFLFGVVMNLWFWPFAAGSSALGWAADAGFTGNLKRYAAFYLATSFGWDAARAAGNVVLVLVLGHPLLASLDRAARRMQLDVTAPILEADEEPAGWPRPRSDGRGVEESPDSRGQDAGERPRRGDPWKVPQKADRLRLGGGKGETVG